MNEGQDERRSREDEPFNEPVQDDPAASVENAEPYFPPTDPVMGEGPADAEAVRGDGDEALAERVRRALAEDAATTDLDLEVEVSAGIATLRGTVAGPEDSDNALAVAGRVHGIDDVVDEMAVEANAG